MIHFIINKGSGFLNISALPSKLRFIIILILILQLLTTIIVLQIQYTTLKKVSAISCLQLQIQKELKSKDG